MVLCWSSYEVADFERLRQNQIGEFVANNKSLQAALDSTVHIMESSGRQLGLSHCLAQYVVHRDSADRFLGYASSHYRFSSQEVRNVMRVEIAKMGIEALKQHLIAVNQGKVRLDDSPPIYLEQLFMLYALTRLKWKCCVMRLHSESTTEMDWQYFTTKFNQVEHTVTTFQNMDKDVLYYPHDQTFPLVEMYYKDEYGNLVGIQTTMSKEHDKNVSTYKKFCDEIETNPESTQLKLYCLILPHQIEHYCQFESCQFWQGVQFGTGSQWNHKISFYALVPPDNFEVNMP